MEFLILWILFGVFSAVGAYGKNRSAVGWFFIGVLFGPFGLISFAMPRVEETEEEKLQSGSMRRCPYCAESIRTEAIVCKHCNRDLDPIEIKEQKDDMTLDIPDGLEEFSDTWKCSSCGKTNGRLRQTCWNCDTERR